MTRPEGLALVLAALLAVGCAAPKRVGVARAAMADRTLTDALGVDPSSVKIQAPCMVWFDHSTRPAMHCVYLQTADTVYFLKYDEKSKSYLPTTQLRFDDIQTAALQRYARNRQVQLRVDGQTMAFHIIHSIMVDRETTEAVYHALVSGGVAAGTPLPWINVPIAPLRGTITIPVYVGR